MIDHLQETLGLTLNESRVYQALIKGIAPDVADLKTETGLPRSRIYEVLASLSAKNLMEKRNSGTGYRLIPPSESIPSMLKQIEKEHQRQIGSIEELGNYLHNTWNDAMTADLSPGVEIYPIEDAEPLFISQISSVKRRVWIAAADSSASMDMQKSGRALAANYKEDLDVRYLVAKNPLAQRIRNSFEHFTPFKNLNIQIRSHDELSASYVLLDGIIYIFFFGGKDIIEPTTLRTSSPQLVDSFAWMFEKLWCEGVEF